MSTPKIRIFKTVSQELKTLATDILAFLTDTTVEKGSVNIALSGGHSPRQLYRLLASTGTRQEPDWSKVFFFFGDERYVLPTSRQSNAYWAEKTLFSSLGIPEKNIFRVNTALEPAKAAADYWQLICQHFKTEEVRFDLVLLGLGSNAHTASLFPHTEVVNEADPAVSAIYVSELSAWRITFTAPLINQAKRIVFLVYGKDKAVAIRNVLASPYDPMQFPAQLIRPERGQLSWYLDEAAASLLPASSR